MLGSDEHDWYNFLMSIGQQQFPCLTHKAMAEAVMRLLREELKSGFLIDKVTRIEGA